MKKDLITFVAVIVMLIAIVFKFGSLQRSEMEKEFQKGREAVSINRNPHSEIHNYPLWNAWRKGFLTK